jgi:adenine-specific DNA-methyltransferase
MSLSFPASDLLESVDFLRMDVRRKTARGRKAELGQYMTPRPVAQLMASMFEFSEPVVRILDPGAGIGTLSAACVSELCKLPSKPKEVALTLYEIDETLVETLKETIHLCEEECGRAGIAFAARIEAGDFIEAAVETLRGGLFAKSEPPSFNFAILNPPYKKIRTESKWRRHLELVGAGTSNLYSAFLHLSSLLLEQGGPLVAITPRSFCNGAYFRSFRESFLRDLGLNRIHVFESRKQAFKDDEILQENIIIHCTKSAGIRQDVLITSSAGPGDELFSFQEVPINEVVRPHDPHHFIRILPSEADYHITESMEQLRSTLNDLGLSVSTGPVVDFRARSWLRKEPEAGTVPLIYPAHMSTGIVKWPLEGRKPNAVVLNSRTEGLVLRNSFYVLVKRFTSKEEKRRLRSALHDPACVPGQNVTFENHVNYFHSDGEGLPPALARGLNAFLKLGLVGFFFPPIQRPYSGERNRPSQHAVPKPESIGGHWQSSRQFDAAARRAGRDCGKRVAERRTREGSQER